MNVFYLACKTTLFVLNNAELNCEEEERSIGFVNEDGFMEVIGWNFSIDKYSSPNFFNL